MFDMNFEKMKMLLKNAAKTMNRVQLEAYVLSFVRRSGMGNVNEKIADEMLKITRPVELIPDIYQEYRQIVHDGIRFMLSHISLKRLVGIAVDQGLMPDGVSARERVISLARQMPTLHKMGQIIARNRNVDQSVRKWLIRLESGNEGSDFALIRQAICEEIGDHAMKLNTVEIGTAILSEASVGVVVPFSWQDPHTGRASSGVLKLVRPSVREYLGEELDVLQDMAQWFDQNRDQYHLKNFGFIDTFYEVRDALQKEMELWEEQTNLEKAARFYQQDKSVKIPGLLPFSTRKMTAMELLDGCKITDADTDQKIRKEYAIALFKALLCSPVFSRKQNTLFHGDPHAGNIFAVKNKKKKAFQVALLDWSLAGDLSIGLRIGLLRLLVAVIMENKDRISKAIAGLTLDNPKKGDPLYDKIEQINADALASDEYKNSRLVARTFLFIDKNLLNGVVFPKELLLFRKADFTLEGVLHDLSPVFVMDDHLLLMIGRLLVREIPKRLLYSMLRPFDRAEHYESLLANKDLEDLAAHFALKTLKFGANIASDVTAFQIGLMAKTLCLPGVICGKCLDVVFRSADSVKDSAQEAMA